MILAEEGKRPCYGRQQSNEYELSFTPALCNSADEELKLFGDCHVRGVVAKKHVETVSCRARLRMIF